MDPKLNDLFKWSIENTSTPNAEDKTLTTESNAASAHPSRPINAEALKTLFGGPSDADLMKESMAAILSPSITLPNKLVAFDNFEQLIESLDNANNMEPLGLWTPLVELLGNEEAEVRRMAAWCVGTAVQNNVKSQEKVGDRMICSLFFGDALANAVAVIGSRCDTYTCEAVDGRPERGRQEESHICTLERDKKLPTRCRRSGQGIASGYTGRG